MPTNCIKFAIKYIGNS